jgi:hypothetical protein
VNVLFEMPFIILVGMASFLNAQEATEEDVSIQDNSFLIEEAYNQEKGVIQHIFNWVPSWDENRGLRHRETEFMFTQEWPIFSQKHQFSFAIPTKQFTDQDSGGPILHAEGLEDIQVNYRYQLLGGSGDELSIAPRFSIVLPSGDENQGLGLGRVGYQFLLPVSKEYDRWCFHFNIGMSMTPDVIAGMDSNLHLPGRTLYGYDLGGSAIYKLLPNFHLMLESLASWNEDLLHEGTIDPNMSLVVSPGVRWAPYTNDKTQWVMGIAAPIGVNREAPDFSLFLYMSFEHPFKMSPK